MCWRTVDANVRASAPSAHARSITTAPDGSSIAHAPAVRALVDPDAVAVHGVAHDALPAPNQRRVETLQVLSERPDHGVQVDPELRVQVGDHLQRHLELGAG